MAVYLCGDIPWPGPTTQPGRLLGQSHRFLSIWTELAAMSRSPVFHVFCTHQPGGKYRLEFEAVGKVQAGEEREAVADYLKQLEARISQDPTQAVAHLLWPCFNLSSARRESGRRPTTSRSRVSRRNASPQPDCLAESGAR